MTALVPLRNHPEHETLRLQWIEQGTNTAAQLAFLTAAWLTVRACRRSPAPLHRGARMTDALGWRHKFGVIAPSTNTIVEPDFYAMGVPGVTAHFSRIHIPQPGPVQRRGVREPPHPDPGGDRPRL
ncbi:hypothetical protein OG912_00040 [Streptomyces sp. NBC_00464]|uniref:hypothetical protein n=1 Tax=Streptomyces sp. NBC_00464 TaxID=2975751 RepID=UPI002E18FEB1